MAAAGASALLFALAQPPVGAWWLVFAMPAPLLLAASGRPPRERAALGFGAGVAAAWLSAVGPAAAGAARFLDEPFSRAVLVTGAIGSLFGGSGFACFAWLAGDALRGSAGLAALRSGAALATGELLRLHLLSGLPWLLVAHALAPAPALLQIAAWGGVAALTAWIGALAAAGLRVLLGPRRRVAGAALVGLVLLGMAADGPPLDPEIARPLPGSARQAGIGEPEAAGALRIALIQPGLPLAEWSDSLRAVRTVEHLTARSASLPRTDLMVWPENAVPVLLPANEALVRSAVERLRNRTDALLLGAPHMAPGEGARRTNAALLYRLPEDADSEPPPPLRHEKVKLLPGFERSPGWLAALGMPGADLSAGDAPRALRLADGTALGPLICFEVLFPALARTHTEAGAGLLVNLSNDAWFQGSSGAEAHFQAAVLLAVTSRRPVLRATPTGVTGAIDATGRVIARLPEGPPGELVVDVWPRTQRSLADQLGPMPGLVLAGAALAGLLAESGRRRGAARARESSGSSAHET